jgi:hypothetical protein
VTRFNIYPYLAVGDNDHLHKTTIILQPSHSAEVLGSPLQAVENRDDVGDDYICMWSSFGQHMLLWPLDYISTSKDTRVGLELKGGIYIEVSVLENRCSNGRGGSGCEEIGVNTSRAKGRDLEATSGNVSRRKG